MYFDQNYFKSVTVSIYHVDLDSDARVVVTSGSDGAEYAESSVDPLSSEADDKGDQSVASPTATPLVHHRTPKHKLSRGE